MTNQVQINYINRMCCKFVWFWVIWDYVTPLSFAEANIRYAEWHIKGHITKHRFRTEPRFPERMTLYWAVVDQGRLLRRSDTQHNLAGGAGTGQWVIQTVTQKRKWPDTSREKYDQLLGQVDSLCSIIGCGKFRNLKTFAIELEFFF